MRKVVKQADSEVIDLGRIDNNSKVVIKWPSDNYYSLVVRGKDEKFYGMSLSDPDLVYSWANDSKHEYVESALSQRGTEVFEFNTYKELYEWVSKQ